MTIKKDKQLYTDSLQLAVIKNNSNERSDEVQEIISKKPDFTERWALICFLCILLLGLIGTWFFHYPDVIYTRAILKGNDPPKEIISSQSGRLIKLFVENNQQIHKGDMIAWIESSGNMQAVLDLSEELHNGLKLLSDGKTFNVSKLIYQKKINLGEFQTAYQSFIISVQQYNEYSSNGFYAKKNEIAFNEFESLEKKAKIFEHSQKITVKDNKLSSKTTQFNDNLIDTNDNFYQSKIHQLESEIDQINHEILSQKLIFEHTLISFNNTVDEWIRAYTLKAPVDGTIVFVLPLQQDQFIEKGKILGFVNPTDTKFYAEIKLPQNYFGKVDTGMQIHLRFDEYPYQEVGFVKGTLNYISSVGVDSVYIGTVRLDNGLQTNLQRKIQYKNGLKADAVIITKDMRLLQRVYHNLFKSISK